MGFLEKSGKTDWENIANALGDQSLSDFFQAV